MFNENQIEVLQKELDASRIKTREKANIKLSYLEGFDVIEAANNIFGFGNWSYLITALEQVSQEVNNNQNTAICYKAIVKIDVFNQDHTKLISRQDVGFGTGVARNLADAHENAAKEAVTDALKRSLKTFGNQFGNSLYDKSRNNSLETKPNSQPAKRTNANLNNQQSDFRQDNEKIALRKLGLDVIEQNGFLVVSGTDIFSKKDAIKSLGFRWDSISRQWYKAVNSNAA